MTRGHDSEKLARLRRAESTGKTVFLRSEFRLVEILLKGRWHNTHVEAEDVVEDLDATRRAGCKHQVGAPQPGRLPEPIMASARASTLLYNSALCLLSERRLAGLPCQEASLVSLCLQDGNGQTHN